VPEKINPIRETNDEARALARRLITEARFGALAVRMPQTGDPIVTRVALVSGPDGAPLSLISDLSSHTAALSQCPRCSVLIGEPGDKGDPLTHPRLTLISDAEMVDKTALKDHYLAAYPKAQLYFDFGDFRMVRFTPVSALLNGGFGKAFELTAEDILPPA